MGFNVVCMIALVFTGGAVEIYTLSNVGYTVSFVPVLIGYYLLRRYRPRCADRSVYRSSSNTSHSALAACYFVIWLYGGIVESSLPNAFLNNNDTRIYYLIGWIILLTYLPLFWYRKKVEDPKYEAAAAALERAAPATGD